MGEGPNGGPAVGALAPSDPRGGIGPSEGGAIGDPPTEGGPRFEGPDVPSDPMGGIGPKFEGPPPSDGGAIGEALGALAGAPMGGNGPNTGGPLCAAMGALVATGGASGGGPMMGGGPPTGAPMGARPGPAGRARPSCGGAPGVPPILGGPPTGPGAAAGEGAPRAPPRGWISLPQPRQNRMSSGLSLPHRGQLTFTNASALCLPSPSRGTQCTSRTTSSGPHTITASVPFGNGLSADALRRPADAV